MKKKVNLDAVKFIFVSFTFSIAVSIVEVAGQASKATPIYIPKKAEAEGNTIWYVLIFALIAGLVGALVWRQKNKNAANSEGRSSNGSAGDSMDADREMEWLRKNQVFADQKRRGKEAKKKSGNGAHKSEEVLLGLEIGKKSAGIQKLSIGEMPIFRFERIEPAEQFSPLALSNDEALLSAIEQAHDEYEEDEEVRDLALRVLSAFKTRNSVEALSQMALYDLSSSIRSRAVVTLTEFDHESVFEAILLACADPTREVRAAAARGLTRLSFNRADAWARLYEMREPGRIRQAARAAMESGFVQRAFDRLIHHDKQNAYEAFVLLALLVKTGESEPVFDELRNNRDMNVRKAILHLLKVTKDESALNELYNLLDDKKISEEMKTEINKTIEEFSLVAA